MPTVARLDRAGAWQALRGSSSTLLPIRCMNNYKEIVVKARNDIPSHMALVVIDQSLAAADELIKDTTMKANGKKGIGLYCGAYRG